MHGKKRHLGKTNALEIYSVTANDKNNSPKKIRFEELNNVHWKIYEHG